MVGEVVVGGCEASCCEVEAVDGALKFSRGRRDPR